jgi:large subunit ribosomal protein L9
MNVILLESVENLGGIGDLVKVKPGYGRNYLLPQGKAALATPDNMKAIEARRAELEKAEAEELAKAKERAKAFDGLEVVIHANAGSEGKLFGSVGPIDIVEALAGVQVEMERAEIRRPVAGSRRVYDRRASAFGSGCGLPRSRGRRRVKKKSADRLAGCVTFEPGQIPAGETDKWSELWTMALQTEALNSASRCRRTP